MAHLHFRTHRPGELKCCVAGSMIEMTADIEPALKSCLDVYKVRSKPEFAFPEEAMLNIKTLKSYLCGPTGSAHELSFDSDVIEIGKRVRAKYEGIKQVLSSLKAEYSTGHVSWDYNPRGPYKELLHQKTMYKAMMQTPCCGILSDAGTCKTASYLWAIDKRLKDGLIKKAMIITLSTLKENVVAEAAVQIPGVRFAFAKSTKNMTKLLSEIDKYDVLVSNYESQRLYDEMDFSQFDMVVCDEGHRIGDVMSKQTQSVMKLFSDKPYRYVVTGSLNANNELSFYMPYRFLGAGFTEFANYYGFRNAYMDAFGPERRIWKPRPHCAATVQGIIGKNGVGFCKDECLDLPGVMEIIRSAPMGPSQLKAYQEIERDMVTTITDMCSKCTGSTGSLATCNRSCGNTIIIDHALVCGAKLRQIASGFLIKTMKTIDDEGKDVNDSQIITMDENPKLTLLNQVLDEIGNQKVIIWTHWTHTIKVLRQHLLSLNNGGVVVAAGNANVFQAIEQFRQPYNKYFLAMPQKAGVGHNIQFSHYQVWFSDYYSYIQYNQALARQDRQGQEHKVSCYHLQCKDSIDETIYKVLQHKEELDKYLSMLANNWEHMQRT